VKRAIVGAVALLLLAAPAVAHETKQVGALTVTIGWRDEPVFSGTRNWVDVTFADAGGGPLVDAAPALTVEVVFGAERMTLPLAPGGRPGLYQAMFVPTRAGTYSFHVAGRIAGQAVDTVSTCSGQSFDCVTDAASIQFPAKDPPSGQLLTRLDRERQRADRSSRDARAARRLALVAVAVAALALVVAVRRGRRPA
jgi:hypothetical protein